VRSCFVNDAAGASASSAFTVTVEAPSDPPLSLPGIPDFTVPSGGSVDTTFPAASGVHVQRVRASSGITFDPSTRQASGTLPTVEVDTTYQVT